VSETREEKGPSGKDLAQARRLSEARGKLVAEVHKAIVGMDEVIEQVLTAVLSRGHCLMVGVPGLAKTLLVSTLSRAMDLSFSRIQFTPDLMPSDITGTDVLQDDPETGRRRFEFVKGPIFANMLLADEINRTPPKTQAALLQAMQEREVTAGEHTFALDRPFFVLATQNPIEQEGTYPLPEAQLDRFMFEVRVGYPGREDEIEIMTRTTSDEEPAIEPVITGGEIIGLQRIVRRVPVARHVYEFALDLVRLTRPTEESAPQFTTRWVSWGAGPRACQYLILAGKARALLKGRFHVTTEDIEFAALPVLRHRLVLSFSAEAEGITVDEIVRKALTLVEKPTAAAV
jgi:MoxR-like ATPase